MLGIIAIPIVNEHMELCPVCSTKLFKHSAELPLGDHIESVVCHDCGYNKVTEVMS